MEEQQMSTLNRDVLFHFRGVPVIHVTSSRIRQEQRDMDLFYYNLRHAEEDWSEPVTVEPYVLVNYFGTIVTTEPIPFESDDHGNAYLEITDEEREEILKHCV
jgi:hypothetical protein